MSRLRPRGEGQKHNHSPGFIVPPSDNRVPSVQGPKTGRVDSAKDEDRLIKRGQLTLPRMLSLAAISGVIVAAVSLGGVWLIIGYWVITLGFCILLLFVAIDYGVKVEKRDHEGQKLEPDATGSSIANSGKRNISRHANPHALTAPRPRPGAEWQAKRGRL